MSSTKNSQDHPITPTIRVFISSTFRDMHAERDHLVTVVFPELRERIERLGLEFFDVDLRWGVPEKNADNEKANSWEYCKQWIDRVEPFFICMLGQRYGWTPGPKEINDKDDRALYNGLSVTEMEIRHAVLTGKLSRRSYFYFRNTAVPKDIPGEVYKEFVDTDHEKDLEKLKNGILEKSGRPVRKYDCHWTGDGFNVVKAFGALVLEDLWSGILRDERYVDKKWWREADINPDTDPLYTNETRPIPEEIWKKIVDLAKPEPKDPLDAERDQMDAFATARLRWFQGRDTELKQLTQFISSTAQDAPRLAVVAAVPGQGKSALLAKLHGELKTSADLVITHFVGATERSANAYELVKRLLGELDRSGIAWPSEQQEEGQEPKLDFNSLCLKLAQRLGDYAGERRIMILIDALNQLSDGHDLQWLPYRLGPRVRVIVSCVDDIKAKPDSPEQRVLKALSLCKPVPLWVPLGPLTEDDVRTIVVSYLKEYCHELDEEYLDIICSITQARNPLYLLVMLNELRTLSGNEMNKKVPELIASMQTDHPDTVSLFRWVLQRMENAEGFGKAAVQWWCLYLAHGRIGMSSSELAELLAIKLGPEAAATALLIERGMRRYLQRRGPQLDFFHGQLKQAVLEQYGKHTDATGVNADLADYFIEIADPEKNQSWKNENSRPFLEIVFHLAGAQHFDALCDTLCDLRFVEARCRLGQVFELIADYRLAKENLPEAQEELHKEREQQERLQRWTREITEYSRQWSNRRDRIAKGEMVNEPEPQLPKPPETCHMWTDEEIEAECQRITDNPTRLDILVAFKGFVESQCYPLLEFGEHPGFVAQHAFNYAPTGPVHETGDTLLAAQSLPCILNNWAGDAKYIPKRACLRTLQGHGKTVRSVSLTPDGRRAVSGGDDKTVRLWDLSSGVCIRVLDGHSERVNSVSITIDGQRAISGGDDGTLRVWDLESGVCLLTMEGHNEGVLSVCVTPDRRCAVSGSFDHSLRVWDLESGVCVRTLQGHSGRVMSVSVTPDGLLAVSGGCLDDNSLRVWNLESGQCLRTLAGHSGVIDCVTITPDGRFAVSGSRDRTLRVWELRSGDCLHILEGHRRIVSSVSMTPDGRRAVSGSADMTLRIWDLEHGVCIRTIGGHGAEVNSVCLTPDGRLAVSGSYDKTLRMWELERGTNIRRIEGDSNHCCVRATPDKCRAVSGSWDSAVWLWDIETAKCLMTLLGHHGGVCTVSVTPDGRWAVSGSWDNTLRVWDLESGVCLRTLNGHSDEVHCVSITSDGRLAVSGSQDNTLRVWDLESDACLRTLEGHTKTVNCVDITPDGLWAISGSNDKTVRVWDLESGVCLRTLEGHSNDVNGVSVTPDGQLAISRSFDGTLRVWNLASGTCQQTLGGNGHHIKSFCLTADGTSAVSGNSDNTLRVWDLTSGTCFLTMEGHSESVLSVGVTPNGRWAVSSGGFDQTLRVWDLERGTCLAVFPTVAPVFSVAVLSERLVARLETGELMFAKMRNIQVIQQ